MGKLVKVAAQSAMDDFYQNFSDNTSYFQLEDFVYRIGTIAADYYTKEWQRMYAELRADRTQEVVAFDPTTLAEEFVKVKKDNETGEWVGDLLRKVLSVPFDLQTSGYQIVMDAKTGEELERSNINETWNYQYQPLNNRKFWRIDRGKIKVFTRGICNLQELRILFVPSITIGDGDEELPDGIVSYCISNTVAYMRAMAQGKIIKKALDNNPNMAFETEMNPKAVDR